MSAEKIGAIGVILSHLRKSQTPFGCVLALGTMDHTQTQPINQLPFSTSIFVLAYYQVKDFLIIANMSHLKEFPMAHVTG